MCPAFPVGPGTGSPFTTMPPPTPVDTTMPRNARAPWPAPYACSPTAMAIASLRRTTGIPGSRARIRSANGKSRQAGMLSGDTSSSRIGPPDPMPTATTGSTASSPIRPASADQTSSASVDTGVARRAVARSEPCGPTRATASLVPPMSIARTGVRAIAPVSPTTYGES